MSWKYIMRTLRTEILRKRPYFAHLAITHRCNLRCRFCHIREERFEELDLDGMKRVIDVLDRMGVAVLSFCGGGEPLLRKDFAAIINYAADKGLYTKITSNGTLPLDRFRELLQSKATEIALSLDGVKGDELPYSHVSPKILRTVRYLNNNIQKGRRLILNVTVSDRNRDQVGEIVDHCTREFPRARIWLNPVVTGEGKLRTDRVHSVDPDYLRHVDSPTLLKADCYVRGVEEHFRSGKYDWGCLAGEFSFDIKPNGDFWICQDQPSHPLLNFLDPDFLEKHRRADFGYRRQCSGCTYSCYFLTQKLFEPSNWPDLARIWWQTATAPNERCRMIVDRYGWAAGLLYFCTLRRFETAPETSGPVSLRIPDFERGPGGNR
jgi:MoaA/NifB/PqqE/SkfB family radical SAM enzyme